MEISLLLVVACLFIGVLVVRTVMNLLVRYALFATVAVLVFADRYGPDVARWMTFDRAAQIALVAGTAMIGTWLLGKVLFRRTRWRFLFMPVTGVTLTALAARVLAG